MGLDLASLCRKDLLGQAIVGFEHNRPEESGSGAEELVILLSGGREIAIFQADDGRLVIESD